MDTYYFDNGATTKVKEEVLNEMIPFFSEEYGNPSSVYHLARNAKKAVEEAREKVEMLMEQMAEQWGVTEELKMQDQMEWVRRMNNIKTNAEEIVYKNIIFM